jgi:hypothetical protein
MYQQLAAALLASLSATPSPGAQPGDGLEHLELDRRAILAMTGSYRVAFHFEETFACAPDYVPTPAYDESAVELVRVVEDRGDFISLQHLLVVDYESEDPMVVKHWRQDWTYEDTEMLLFRGHSVWERVSVTSDEAAGTWTQAVHQVGDSPRYEGRGRWRHAASSSTWESDETWRPLPRREKQREDYHVIAARNVHTVTPSGWAHEEHNRKLVLSPDGSLLDVLVHEQGFNTYRPDAQLDLALAEAYWDGTQSFWADVRATWSAVLEAGSAFRIEGGRTTNAFSALADEYLTGAWHDDGERLTRLREEIGKAVAPHVVGRAVPASSGPPDR